MTGQAMGENLSAKRLTAMANSHVTIKKANYNT
jgi:hypothetical protein